MSPADKFGDLTIFLACLDFGVFFNEQNNCHSWIRLGDNLIPIIRND